MKTISFIFDRRLYDLLQEEGRTQFTTRELRDAYAKYLEGIDFRLGDVRRYVYEQIRLCDVNYFGRLATIRMAGWVG